MAVNLWYHVGSKDEERRQRGFAHLFEHLMFEGSEHFPGDFFKPLQRLGASINGSTSTDRTNYVQDVPAAHVELAMAMESDRMGHLLPALTDAKLRVQKDVVKNEYRQNYANRPYGMSWRLLAEAMYPPNHPYSWLTIGVMEDVEAASREDVEAFFRRFYVPGNASLCVVGDIDEDRAFALAERYFGTIPGGSAALRPWTPEAALSSRRLDHAERPRRARPDLPDLAHRPPVPRRRRRAAAPGRRTGARQVEPALPQAGRRPGAGAGRLGATSRAGSWRVRSAFTSRCGRGSRASRRAS